MTGKTPSAPPSPAPTHHTFATPQALRLWFIAHHTSAAELWLAYWKKGSGQPSVTWQESVDEALCVGWIDGVRKRLDEQRYVIRFTPRRPGSIWSAVNLQRVAALTAEGRMLPAGLQVHAARDPAKAGIYSFEQRLESFAPAHEAQFRAHAAAWAEFCSRPGTYRRAVMSWVANAKQAATQQRRLEAAIAHAARGEALPQFTRR